MRILSERGSELLSKQETLPKCTSVFDRLVLGLSLKMHPKTDALLCLSSACRVSLSSALSLPRYSAPEGTGKVSGALRVIKKTTPSPLLVFPPRQGRRSQSSRLSPKASVLPKDVGGCSKQVGSAELALRWDDVLGFLGYSRSLQSLTSRHRPHDYDFPPLSFLG